MMDRRTFIGSLACFPLARSLDAVAQQAGKVWRIGYLASGARPSDGAPPAALRQALQELGYLDGTSISYVGRWAEVKKDRLPGLAAEMVGLKVDLIVAFGAPAAEAAKEATSTIPIVVVNAGDPVGIGLIASLARPGGNVSGISDQATELSPKRLELLKEAMPNASNIAVLWNAGDRAMTLRYREIEKAARKLGVTIRPLGVREPDDFDVAFTAMTREHPDALLLITDALTNLNRGRILDFAAAHRVPAMYEFGSLVREGGLMSYGPDLGDSFRRAAVYVDRILKGAKPSELPVEQPNRYYLLVNLKTAKALGLTIPQSLLLRADEVIQ
jgi:putative tryptophan/tyrosine transport system substrate-binding protein